MKNLLIIIFLTISTNAVQAQIPINHICKSAKKICDVEDESFNLNGYEEYCTEPLYYSFHEGLGPTTNFVHFHSETSGGNLYLYHFSGYEGICNDMGSNSVSLVGSVAFDVQESVSIPYYSDGFYILKVVHNSCYTNSGHWGGPVPAILFTVSIDQMSHVSCPDLIPYEPEQPDELDCTDCISSFSPASGKYMVSAWVSEEGASIHTVTYANASIGVSFTGNAATYQLAPTGRIIDGWQQIQGVIEIPDDATDLHLALKSGTVNAYFDDIRFYPLDGSMVSYVYDPVNLRLMAELDERNYATFYEYDEEGKLIRVKKETERGVMTIQENRDNIIKKQ